MAKEVGKEEKKEEKKEVLSTSELSLDIFSGKGSESSEGTGLEAVDQTDLKLPKVKIVQTTSEEFTKSKITPGFFYNNVTKQASETIDCILLALGKSRVMWPKQFKRGDKPLCRSFDAVRKTEGCGDGTCQNCQYAKWPESGETPDCTQGYIWLAVDKDANPFRFPAQGASVAPTKDFLNAVVPKLSKGGKHLGIFVFKVRLSTEQQTNDKGTYYVIKYDIIGTIGADDYDNLESMSASLKELFLKAIDQDTQVVDVADNGSVTSDPTNASTNEDAAPKGKNGVLF
jgi:hypothetical protein